MKQFISPLDPNPWNLESLLSRFDEIAINVRARYFRPLAFVSNRWYYFYYRY